MMSTTLEQPLIWYSLYFLPPSSFYFETALIYSDDLFKCWEHGCLPCTVSPSHYRYYPFTHAEGWCNIGSLRLSISVKDTWTCGLQGARWGWKHQAVCFWTISLPPDPVEEKKMSIKNLYINRIIITKSMMINISQLWNEWLFTNDRWNKYFIGCKKKW